MRLATVLTCVAALATVLAPGAALAQVPPHAPGTICFTPDFWCWAQLPGPPGQVCSCPTGDGPVSGVLG